MHHGPAAPLHLANDILYVPALLRVQDKAVPAPRKACGRAERRNNFVRVARLKAAQAALRASVLADLLHGTRSVPEAVDRAVVTIKRRSARSVLARVFLKPNRASHSMLASRRHAAGRSSKSDTRKVNASCIPSVREPG